MELFDLDLDTPSNASRPDQRGSLRERFIAKLDRQDANGCQLWAGASTVEGRGQIGYRGKMVMAPRVAYVIAYGPFNDSLVVRHKCDVPNCVEPSHLELGTQADNARDREERGRGHLRKGGANGSAKLTEAQVLDIYQRVWAGEKGRDLAAEFGVGRSTISRIKFGKSWAHVTGHFSQVERGMSLTPAT